MHATHAAHPNAHTGHTQHNTAGTQGHYAPAVAFKVYQASELGRGPPINLKGVAIGNGLTNPAVQYGAYADFALQNKLISQSVRALAGMAPGFGGRGGCEGACGACDPAGSSRSAQDHPLTCFGLHARACAADA
jgi:hypothetical protein